MKVQNEPSFFQVLRQLPAIFRAKPQLLATPASIGVTLLISGVSYAYYSIFQMQRLYKETDMYKESIKHLRSYEPVNKYLGDPLQIKWISESHHDEKTITLVVPLRGPKGKAELIINGRRGKDDKPEIDSLELELKRPVKRWKFLQARSASEATSNDNNDTLSTIEKATSSMIRSPSSSFPVNNVSTKKDPLTIQKDKPECLVFK